MTHPQKQHYVPQFLLRNFTLSGSDQLYVYDKSNDRTYKTNITNVAAEREFYDFRIDGIDLTIEPSLGKIEVVAASEIDEIILRRSIGHLSLEKKTILSLFIAIQMVRTRHVRVSMDAMLDQVREKIRSWGQDPDQVPQLRKGSEDEDKLSTARIIQNAVSFVPPLMDKVWLLFRADDEGSLYISDNPVTLHNERTDPLLGTLGIAVEGIEINFPISRHFSLALYCHSHRQSFLEDYEKYKLLQRTNPASAARIDVDPFFMEGLYYGMDNGRAVPLPAASILHLLNFQ
ncbi:MAG: DUF4238 domain-containing protein [Deltaproteobacteria bacterium]|nr:DUF4238 domain-containing protein [Deltaproteobacteria bacterium]